MTAPTPPSFIAPFLARAAHDAFLEDNRAALFANANSFAALLARSSPLDAKSVYQALTFFPDNMLVLLQSPEGWAALAECIAADFGTAPIQLEPTIH